MRSLAHVEPAELWHWVLSPEFEEALAENEPTYIYVLIQSIARGGDRCIAIARELRARQHDARARAAVAWARAADSDPAHMLL